MGPTSNFGVVGRITGTPPVPVGGTRNYGVMGDLGVAAVPCPMPPCPPVTVPDAGVYSNGDIVVTTGIFWASDANLKTNIQDLQDPMILINQLQPKTYDFDQQSNQSMQLPSGTQAGLLAQDVEAVLPALVKTCIHPARYDSLGNETYAEINYKAVNYVELIPYLIAAIKEQQSQIEALQNAQPQQLHQHPGGGNDSGSSIDVTLSSRSIVLNQNAPNPFKEQTVIEYFIPEDASNVKIIFTDNKGSVIKEVEISEKGKGQLNVYAADLSSGIYSYTIVADGITIDSKQMVKTK